MTERRYRGRFAPTPSGPLHFGSIIAALGSCLEARVHDGAWHVRIDDLDPPRVVPGASDDILHCLEALGFEWDGEVTRQSQREAAYHAAFHRLRTLGLAYPCACSRSEIAEAARNGAEGPVYPGTCRHGMPAGRAARAWRMRTEGATVHSDDGVLGPQVHDVEHDGGDFVLYRADHVYAFHLAAAIDDHEQGMTHVVRGADLLESSARQMWLLERMGLPTPQYAHLPVAVNPDGQKLSKQTHAAPVDPSRPVEALWPALAFLGQQPPPALLQGTVEELWGWARSNWQLARVPHVREFHLSAWLPATS